MPTAVAPLVLAYPTRLPAIRLNDDAATPVSSWIQVAVVGDYEDSRYGRFSITTEMLHSMVLNFTEGKFPTPPTEIAVDYDHLSTKESKVPGDAKAAAWFKELQTRADGTELWARVEWTPAGAEAVKSGEYRFFSPYFTTNFVTNTGTEIGPCLINGAITNRPFLQGMQPLSLALSRDATLSGPGAMLRVLRMTPMALAQMTDDDKRQRVAYAIEQQFGAWHDDYYGWDVWLITTIDGREAVFCRHRNSRTGSPAMHYIVGYTIADDGTVTFTSDPEEVVTNWTRLSAGVGGTSLMAKFALTAANGTKVEVEQSAIEALPFVKELMAKLPKDGQTIVASADYEKLTTDVKALSASVEKLTTESAANKDAADKANKALAQAAADKKVDALIAAGKVTPAQRESYIELALNSADMFEKLTKDMPVVVKLNTVSGSGEAVETDKAGKLKALTVQIRQADPKLSEEQAMAKALEQQPDLYEG